MRPRIMLKVLCTKILSLLSVENYMLRKALQLYCCFTDQNEE